MSQEAKLQKWCEGLSEDQRNEACRAEKSKVMTDAIADSLIRAGVSVSAEHRKNHTFPPEIETYIRVKMRHG
jgi:hypothetical protein